MKSQDEILLGDALVAVKSRQKLRLDDHETGVFAVNRIPSLFSWFLPFSESDRPPLEEVVHVRPQIFPTYSALKATDLAELSNPGHSSIKIDQESATIWLTKQLDPSHHCVEIEVRLKTRKYDRVRCVYLTALALYTLLRYSKTAPLLGNQTKSLLTVLKDEWSDTNGYYPYVGMPHRGWRQKKHVPRVTPWPTLYCHLFLDQIISNSPKGELPELHTPRDTSFSWLLGRVEDLQADHRMAVQHGARLLIELFSSPSADHEITQENLIQQSIRLLSGLLSSKRWDASFTENLSTWKQVLDWLQGYRPFEERLRGQSIEVSKFIAIQYGLSLQLLWHHVLKAIIESSWNSLMAAPTQDECANLAKNLSARLILLEQCWEQQNADYNALVAQVNKNLIVSLDVYDLSSLISCLAVRKICQSEALELAKKLRERIIIPSIRKGDRFMQMQAKEFEAAWHANQQIMGSVPNEFRFRVNYRRFKEAEEEAWSNFYSNPSGRTLLEFVNHVSVLHGNAYWANWEQ